MSHPTADLDYRAREQVRRALREMAMHPGAADEPNPLEALAVLLHLRTHVTRAERETARRAREDGRSWGAIGEACGLGVSGPGVAEDAFRRFAVQLAAGPPVFPWTCRDCGELIGDRGPVWGDAEDAEPDHGGGCERFAATVQAWDERWKDGSDEGDGNG